MGEWFEQPEFRDWVDRVAQRKEIYVHITQERAEWVLLDIVVSLTSSEGVRTFIVGEPEEDPMPRPYRDLVGSSTITMCGNFKGIIRLLNSKERRNART